MDSYKRRGTRHLRGDGRPKDGFDNQEAATRFKWHIVETTGTSPEVLRAYHCHGERDSCGKWHVGHYRTGRAAIEHWKARRRA